MHQASRDSILTIVVRNHSEEAFNPGNDDGCMQARRVRLSDDRSPSGACISTFMFATAAVQINPYLFKRPDPESDYARLHAIAVANGQVFTPNSGQSWFIVVHFKTPYHSTY